MHSSQQQQQGQGSPPPAASCCKRPRTAMKPLPPEHRAALRGKYELVSFRGEGSFSEVWEARHLRTGLRVAIKILCHAKMRKEKLKPEREPRVMRLLSLGRHPHIAHFYEAIRPVAAVASGGDHQHTYIVMELAESGELHDHVTVQERERLPEAEARRIFQQVAAAVAYCHRNRVAHRDLKMENVLLDAEGRVKLADFGFSKFWSPGKMQRKSLGSRAYAAPELLEGRPYWGPEVDVWACGVILYAMLCGGYPFDDTDMSDLPRNIRRGEYRVPSWISDDARDLISSMLIVRPEKRATMAEVTAHRWLQPDMPPHLAMPPPDATAARRGVDAATVELLVTFHGFERTSLLQSIRLDDGSEAAVAYQLVLSKQHDAATLYQLSMPPPPPPPGRHQWALDGGEQVLRECPRQTMRRIAKALRELGVGILSYHSHRHRHLMVCAYVRGTGGAGVPTAATVPRFLRRHKDGGGSSSSSSEDAIATATATDDDDTAAVDRLSEAAVVFEIQLLKSRERNSNGNSQHQYVLHLKRTSGPQIPYLGVCSQLASKLKSNPY